MSLRLSLTGFLPHPCDCRRVCARVAPSRLCRYAGYRSTSGIPRMSDEGPCIGTTVVGACWVKMTVR